MQHHAQCKQTGYSLQDLCVEWMLLVNMDYSCANWLRVVPVQLNYGMPIKGIYPVKLRWCWPGDQQPEPGI